MHYLTYLVRRTISILVFGFAVSVCCVSFADAPIGTASAEAMQAAAHEEVAFESAANKESHDDGAHVGHPPLPSIVHDLGLILVAGAIMLLLFKWLHQPVILGYLIAGFIVSPYFLPTDPNHELYSWYEWLYPYIPAFIPKILQVRDPHSIEVWAVIGVIFMLFGLGLEFSFKRLIANGKIAAITGGFEVISTTIIGFFVGKILGWDNIHSIFFGAMLAMSSTTIILKVFDELQLKGRAFAPIVFGALIVEDILAMLLLVMLASIVLTQQFAGG
ncbi:MAG: cation:proton antiporter, partial [Planctomycetaceae bacterium]|nr:cation:proton antiporter [Planctomycetaceae bacterium]